MTEPVDIFAEWVDTIDEHKRRKEARRQRNDTHQENENQEGRDEGD